MNRYHRNWLACVVAASAMSVVGCGDDDGGTPDAGMTPDSGGETPDSGGETPDSGGETPDSGIVLNGECPAGGTMVSGDITSDTTWSAANIYCIAGLTYVLEDSTLTVEAGTQIFGLDGGALIVTRGSRLEAVGTAAAPIVFTSPQPIAERDRGDWSGVVLLGAATINVAGGETAIEGLPPGPRGSYGGTDDAHDCGHLEYVRIEYAGDVYAMDNELNGLTLGGCGSETVIDYVQVHAGADDAFEMFGGTVSLRHVIATAMDDDGIDWDFGWRGNVQFALVIHTASASSGDPNGIEADNNGTSNDATPRSSPTIYNLTAVGSPDIGNNSFGAVLRRGTYGSIYNAIFTSWKTAAVDARDASTIAAIGTSLTIENSLFHQNGAGGTAHFSATATPFGTEPTNDTATDPMIGDSAPYAPSAAITDGAATPTGEWFDATATFVGAIGAEDWTAGWSSFPGL